MCSCDERVITDSVYSTEFTSSKMASSKALGNCLKVEAR